MRPITFNKEDFIRHALSKIESMFDEQGNLKNKDLRSLSLDMNNFGAIKPKAILSFTTDAFEKMSRIVKDTDTEICWHGVVHKSTEMIPRSNASYDEPATVYIKNSVYGYYIPKELSFNDREEFIRASSLFEMRSLIAALEEKGASFEDLVGSKIYGEKSPGTILSVEETAYTKSMKVQTRLGDTSTYYQGSVYKFTLNGDEVIKYEDVYNELCEKGAVIKKFSTSASSQIPVPESIYETSNLNQRAIYQVSDILIYPQKVTGTFCESDDDLYGPWIVSLPADKINNMRLQGHSHVNMGVTPSGTDRGYYSQMIETYSDARFYIFMVVNKKGEMHCEIHDFEDNLRYDKEDIEMRKTDSEGNSIKDWVAGESKDKVKPRTTATSYYNSGGTYSGYGYKSGAYAHSNQTSVYDGYSNSGYYGKAQSSAAGSSKVTNIDSAKKEYGEGVKSAKEDDDWRPLQVFYRAPSKNNNVAVNK